DLRLGGRELVAGGAAADAGELGTGALGPQRRAELLEDSKRFLQRPAGGSPPLCPPLDDAQHEERTRPLERHRQALVMTECELEPRLRGVEAALSGSDE